LIVTGSNREEAVQRARRALSEFVVDGLATALPFHRAIMDDPAFTEVFNVYTSYIENEFNNEIPPFAQTSLESQTHAAAEHLVTEVNGKRFEIYVHAPEPVHKRHRAKQGASGASTGTALTSPMQGTVVKIAVTDGQQVEAGELIVVLEAMKMEQPLSAHRSGVVANLNATVGETVSSGSTLCDIIDA
jgi:acetyl-CoA/propionyl-CoA carboxylase biotin carboxyl carrier protein